MEGGSLSRFVTSVHARAMKAMKAMSAEDSPYQRILNKIYQQAKSSLASTLKVSAKREAHYLPALETRRGSAYSA